MYIKIEASELFLEFEQLNNYKIQFIEQKVKCESNNCSSSESLKKIIASKDKIIQSVASALTKLNETKNFKIVNEVFKILCGEAATLTPPSEGEPANIKTEPESQVYSPESEAPKLDDMLIKEESLMEIEGTPTGRKSPIIQTRKFSSITNINKTNSSDKKKCPDSWPTPEKKSMKLSHHTPPRNKPNSRWKQSRLPLTILKPSSTVDLTSSPEFFGGSRVKNDKFNVQTLIKKESIEGEDTILPSPTSGSTDCAALYKTTTKFKAPLSLIRDKSEKVKLEKNTVENQMGDNSDATNIEDSINLLQPNRTVNKSKRKSPKSKLMDEDSTHCDTNDSVSLLRYLLEGNEENVGKQNMQFSPKKQPLAENKNLLNTPEKDVHIDSSMSLLRPEFNPSKVALFEDQVKSKPDVMEPIYKEPTVRKKAEKLALPGWSCDQCKEFYDELYKDNPEMLAKKMDECSKHRGRNNPARPKTPTGFWNPRWDVPEDTEEFNRRNNAV
ncbi:uncharacterized protein LOC113520519 isoform X2 [Galleria mellonella]|uniref:Uncharacterized protein LOC113520519 isoform X2 n=1 Tax=Galleria mellonella TaxID=7137 RepID=A0A6J3C1S3_GALME|nr:uncharacterized protein LOC113520519 isoform X2 [Galleria mellonella]